MTTMTWRMQSHYHGWMVYQMNYKDNIKSVFTYKYIAIKSNLKFMWHHDIVEIMLKLALNTNKSINQIYVYLV